MSTSTGYCLRLIFDALALTPPIHKSYLDYSIDRIEEKINTARDTEATGFALKDAMKPVMENEEKAKNSHFITLPLSVMSVGAGASAILVVTWLPLTVSGSLFLVGATGAGIVAGTGIRAYDVYKRTLASDIILEKLRSEYRSGNIRSTDTSWKEDLKNTLESTIFWKRLFANKAYKPGDVGLFGC